jgi:GH15 family glucan-1,4-alpha-glucosidase
LRTIEGIEGRVELALCVAARFDYGQMRPWVRRHTPDCFTAIGGDDGLIIRSDTGLEIENKHDIGAKFSIEAGQRHYLSVQYARPELLDPKPPQWDIDADEELEKTISLWRRWAAKGDPKEISNDSLMRSALVLKALNYAPTGAIVAAATISLPESLGNDLNWDYRFSWRRDSWLTVRALGTLGFFAAADGFRRFIQRSSAGHGDEIQLMYGLGGERRLTEINLDYLEGYRGTRPVRIGNAASRQLQLDMYGELLELAWQWRKGVIRRTTTTGLS